ncbi:CS1 type fimbrial major subunit [Yersinia pestis]|uniref:CS1 type fimbrial major subunit n=1 Tax=Yersinia pestis TaxID=632 RepID=UPI000576151E|nr:CS1 type fimbrial major subunit [Yersinia pestis]
MMKKTVIAIITMATLTSTAAYANTIEKDIRVEAEIISLMDVKRADDSNINKIKLTYDTVTNDGTYSHSEAIKVKARKQLGDKLKVSLAAPVILSEPNNNKEFTHVEVLLDGKKLLEPADTRDLIAFHGSELNAELKVSAKEPNNAVGGEKYSGVIQLRLEPSA